MRLTKTITEHKPLSAYKYFLNNKKRSFSMILAIAVSILAAMVFQLVFYAVAESGRMSMSGRLDYLTVVYPGDNGIVTKNITDKIKGSSNLEKIVPMLVSTTDYYHLFGNLNIPVYEINSENLSYVIDRLGMKLVTGSLPKPDSNEILLDEKTLKNKGKRLGDYFGREINPDEKMPGKNKIAGVLKGDCLIGLMITNNSLYQQNGYLMFAKDGKLDSLNQVVTNVSSLDAKIQTKEYAEKFRKEELGTLLTASSIIAVIIIFIMSFAAGNSSYAQYFSRRYEFAMLQSLGYSRFRILIRAAKEILLINIAGLIMGILLLLIVALGLKILIFDPKGYPFVFISPGGLFLALIIPMCTMVFSLIPAWWTLSRVDHMDIVEKYE
ncbi:MAG: hypothetical protein Q8920_00255 [Bacillota bacterium]|nr:hypothetical protein [Bacillota bacterium]